MEQKKVGGSAGCGEQLKHGGGLFKPKVIASLFALLLVALAVLAIPNANASPPNVALTVDANTVVTPVLGTTNLEGAVALIDTNVHLEPSTATSPPTTVAVVNSGNSTTILNGFNDSAGSIAFVASVADGDIANVQSEGGDLGSPPCQVA